MALVLAGLAWAGPPARAAAVDAAAASSARPGDAVAEELLAPVEAFSIRLESGRLESAGAETFRVRDPVIRGLAEGSRGEAARIDFTYLGPSRDEAPLGSGELRRQIGLKLRAQDGCNVVYVMWRIGPGQGVHVQLKSNPGASTHRQCRDQGYQAGTPSTTRPVRPIQIGERRSLAAWLEGRALRVLADGLLVWDGLLPEAARDLTGPAGFRSDNGAFEIAFRAAGPAQGSSRR